MGIVFRARDPRLNRQVAIKVLHKKVLYDEDAEIPKETYDYVFLIFAAAVICENPKLFGFDGACPVCTKPRASVSIP